MTLDKPFTIPMPDKGAITVQPTGGADLHVLTLQMPHPAHNWPISVPVVMTLKELRALYVGLGHYLIYQEVVSGPREGADSVRGPVKLSAVGQPIPEGMRVLIDYDDGADYDPQPHTVRTVDGQLYAFLEVQL